MSERKAKPSGAVYRKIKAERDSADKLLSGSLQKYFKSSSTQEPVIHSQSTKENNSLRANCQSSNENIDSNSATTRDEADEQETLTTGEANSRLDEDENRLYQKSCGTQSSSQNIQATEKQSILCIDHDPGNWPDTITHEIRQQIIENGPVQLINHSFPKNESGRSFTISNYQRVLPNGEKINRDWLVYLKKKNDVIYCFCCKLFNNVDTSLGGSAGFCDWRNLSRVLTLYETSKKHLLNTGEWLSLNKRLETNMTIDATHQHLLDAEKRHWRKILKWIIEVVKYLAVQCLAFRGNNDMVYQPHNGNFLKLIEMIGKLDDTVGEHLRRIRAKTEMKKKKLRAHYLGKNIQNEIIAAFSDRVKGYIVKRCQDAKYFAIILDCTPDKSHIEQISVIIRFVSCEPGRDVEVEERFICFAPIEDTTGDGLAKFLLKTLGEIELPIQDIRGQGYDNGSNMRGKNAGVQNRIRTINPRAFFVPCAAHSLNLVVNDAAKLSFEMVGFFSFVHELYNFFSGSTKRWSVLQKHVTTLSLKPLSETRWESRIIALKPLRFHVGEIYDALLELHTDMSEDSNTRHAASTLASKLKGFKILCSIVIWYDILLKVNATRKLLQSPKTDIRSSILSLKNLKTHFEGCRSGDGFAEVIRDATEQLGNRIQISRS